MGIKGLPRMSPNRIDTGGETATGGLSHWGALTRARQAEHGLFARELAAQFVAHQRPHLIDCIGAGDLLADFSVKVLGACAGRFACNGEAVAQHQHAEGQQRELRVFGLGGVFAAAPLAFICGEVVFARNVRLNVCWRDARSGQALGLDFLLNGAVICARAVDSLHGISLQAAMKPGRRSGIHGSSLGFGLAGLALGVACVEASQSQVVAKAWACVAPFITEQEAQRRLRHPGLLRDFLLREPKAIEAGFKFVPVHALHIAMPISLWQ